MDINALLTLETNKTLCANSTLFLKKERNLVSKEKKKKKWL